MPLNARRARSFVFACALPVGALGISDARRAEACGWDNETLPAESGSLACVYDAVMGSFPKHTTEYYETRLAAAQSMLAWQPYDVDALDLAGIAALKLKRFDVAETAMKRRHAVHPEDYASDANLGTLYTFTGDFDKALTHTRAALAKEPNAHFGREHYHEALIVYLRDLAKDPEVAQQNFLRVEVTNGDRATGSPQKLATKGVKDDVFDALVAMITVYGADEVPFVYQTLGDMLALDGSLRLAWVAYHRASLLHHPAAKEVLAEENYLRGVLRGRQEARHPGDPKIGHSDFMGVGADIGGAYYLYASDQSGPMLAREKYRTWERQQIKLGLPVWTDAGVRATYAKANELVPRCKSPHVIDERKWESP